MTNWFASIRLNLLGCAESGTPMYERRRRGRGIYVRSRASRTRPRRGITARSWSAGRAKGVLEPVGRVAHERHHVVVGGFVDDESDLGRDPVPPTQLHRIDAARPLADPSRGPLRIRGNRVVRSV